MSADDNKRIIHQLYEQGWGQGDLAVIRRVFAAEHVLHWHDNIPSDQRRTVEEVEHIVSAYRAAFPDLQVTVDQMVAEDDRVAVQVTFAGTHSGDYEGFPPTHQFSRFTDMQIMRLEDGRIVETSLASGGLRYFLAILDGSAFKDGG